MDHYSDSNADTDLWQVEMGVGDVRTFTLEQLDEALDLGIISTETRVWQAGMDAAVPLHELLGDDSEDDAAPATMPAPSHRERDVTLTGMSPPSEPELVPSYVRAQEPAPRMSTPPTYGYEAPPARTPAPQSFRTAVPAYSVPPQSFRAIAPAPMIRESAPARAVSAWPPVVSAPPPSSPGYHASVVPSVAPMAFDLGDDDDVPFPKSKRRGMPLVASLVVLLAAGGGFAAYKNGALDSTPTAAAAVAPAAVARPAPEPEKSHAYDPGNAPIHWADPTPPAVSSAVADALAGKKDVHVAKTGHAAHNASPHKSGKSGKSGKSSGFTTKGSKYDPLNGSL